MTGEKLYALYCREMAKLPYSITKGEALPSWEFVDGDLGLAWNRLGTQLAFVPVKPKPKKRLSARKKS